jgi:peptide/nickel transport system substrate-binding protein
LGYGGYLKTDPIHRRHQGLKISRRLDPRKGCKPCLWSLLLVCLYSAACAFASGPTTGVAPAFGKTGLQVLRFGVQVSGMGTLDPHKASGSQDRALADMVFNGLLRYQPGNAPRIEPDLASDIPGFKIVGGRQVWTVHLRHGVFFHPGPKTPVYELTADDVVFSLRESANPRFSAFAGEYAGMSFEKVDPFTVDIVLKKPLSSILFFPKIANYSGGFIVSKRAFQAMGYDAFSKHPVGTGAFVFESYDPGKKLVLKANERYFRGRPLLDGVAILFFPDIHEREQALLAGRLDVITGSGEKGWIEQMEQHPGVAVDVLGAGELAAIYFNTHLKPLDDVRVRRAMAYALNREAFLADASRRLVESAYSPVPAAFLPGGIKKKTAQALGLTYATDLEKARALLAAAGYPNGFSLDLVTSEKRFFQSLYRVMSDQWARVGIICHIRQVSHSQMHRIIRQDPKPVVIYGAWRPNADVYLSGFFHSAAIIVTGARPDTNFSHYDKIDNLIEAARAEIDPEKQVNLWVQAQIRILSDMAAYPIMTTKQCYARSRRVDYGHPLVSSMALYPQFTEKTRLKSIP